MIKQLDATQFNGSLVIDWFSPPRPGPANQLGAPCDLNPNAFTNATSGIGVTVRPADPAQAILVNRCVPLGLRCNVEEGTGLLLATNTTGAPIRLDFSVGVQAVGAFVVAQANFGIPFTALMWVWLTKAARWEMVSTVGMTGDIFDRPGDSLAPFVGGRAPRGDAISSVLFDAVHPTDEMFSPLGIGRLYLVP